MYGKMFWKLLNYFYSNFEETFTRRNTEAMMVFKTQSQQVGQEKRERRKGGDN